MLQMRCFCAVCLRRRPGNTTGAASQSHFMLEYHNDVDWVCETKKSGDLIVCCRTWRVVRFGVVFRITTSQIHDVRLLLLVRLPFCSSSVYDLHCRPPPDSTGCNSLLGHCARRRRQTVDQTRITGGEEGVSCQWRPAGAV